MKVMPLQFLTEICLKIFKRLVNLWDYWLLFRKIFVKREIRVTTINYLLEKNKFEFLLPKAGYKKAELLVEAIERVCVPRERVHLERVGEHSDSGYWIPPNYAINFVIGAGVGANNDLEYHFANLGAEVLAVDPTVRGLPKPHRNIKHVKSWLSNTSDPKSKKTSISELLTYSRKDNTRLLKLDIEGGEYESLVSALGLLSSFQIIIIEFHEMYKLGDEVFRKRIESILFTLEVQFEAVSFTSNNWRPFVQFGNAFVPEVFEVVFVNKSSLNKLKREELGEKVNYPNNPNRLEVPNQPFYFAD